MAEAVAADPPPPPPPAPATDAHHPSPLTLPPDSPTTDVSGDDEEDKPKSQPQKKQRLEEKSSPQQVVTSPYGCEPRQVANRALKRPSVTYLVGQFPPVSPSPNAAKPGTSAQKPRRHSRSKSVSPTRRTPVPKQESNRPAFDLSITQASALSSPSMLPMLGNRGMAKKPLSPVKVAAMQHAKEFSQKLAEESKKRKEDEKERREKKAKAAQLASNVATNGDDAGRVRRTVSLMRSSSPQVVQVRRSASCKPPPSSKKQDRQSNTKQTRLSAFAEELLEDELREGNVSAKHSRSPSGSGSGEHYMSLTSTPGFSGGLKLVLNRSILERTAAKAQGHTASSSSSSFLDPHITASGHRGSAVGSGFVLAKSRSPSVSNTARGGSMQQLGLTTASSRPLEEWERSLGSLMPKDADIFTFFELLNQSRNVHQSAIVVPDTILYNYGQPAAWYYTDPHGVVCKKEPRDVNPTAIIHGFLRGKEYHRGAVVAMQVFFADGRLQTTYLDENAFKHVVQNPSIQVGFIQRFLNPPTERNTVLRVMVQPHNCSCEKRMNYNLLKDYSLPPDKRCVTFDGHDVHSMPVSIKHKSTKELLTNIGKLLTTMVGYCIQSRNEIRLDCPLEAIVRSLVVYLHPLRPGQYSIMFAEQLSLARNVQSVQLPTLPPDVVLEVALETNKAKVVASKGSHGQSSRAAALMQADAKSSHKVIEQLTANLKSQCPRCDAWMDSREKFSISFASILRHLEKITNVPLGANNKRNARDNEYDFGRPEMIEALGYSPNIPVIFQKIEPLLRPSAYVSASEVDQLFTQQCQQKDFLARTVKVCLNCQLHMHDSTLNDLAHLDKIAHVDEPLKPHASPLSLTKVHHDLQHHGFPRVSSPTSPSSRRSRSRATGRSSSVGRSSSPSRQIFRSYSREQPLSGSGVLLNSVTDSPPVPRALSYDTTSDLSLDPKPEKGTAEGFFMTSVDE